MLNRKISIHIVLTCLAVLSYASIASATCEQEAIVDTILPPCNPAASASCYVVGSNSEICASEPANRFYVNEWRPEYECYAKYGICERDDNGQCEWRSTDELSQCIANARSGFMESIKPCTNCPTLLEQLCQ